MSLLRTLPRTAVDTYIKAIKWPIERGARFVSGGNGNGTTPAELAVDRADAAARELAGSVLGDDQLKQDANRRRTATDKREQAVELKAKAEERKQKAEQRKQQSKSRAAQTAQQRKQASAKAAAKQQEAIEEKANRARLEALEEKEEALDKREDALTATDEAERLAKAAAKVKTERKNS